LDGNDPAARKTAAKRVIALMRAGENVQFLFSNMLRCVQTDDIELKKLVYLYLINYSTQEPEQAIMAVGTFVKDAENRSPLIRALAVRTMCRIRLESVAENMIIPLKRCLSDPDAYVRKTAAFGVAKLYDVIPEAVENAGLFADLLNLLKDENPMVISNTTAAIFEINDHRTTPIFTLTPDTISPILNAFSACSEWCQCILLDALSRYVPTSKDDANFLIDRLIPFLKHKNPAVVIGSFKCIFLYMDTGSRNPTDLFPQIIPPFITLVTSSQPEVQYVVLRTLSLFVQKYPKALLKEIRVFFCKYNDPSYVKMEKLDIIVTVCGPQTAQLVLDELNEYCNTVDVAFVRKSVRAVGQIAIKVEAAARRCVDILIGLVGGKADYAVEESVIVMTDILRKFPGIFESTLQTVCQNFEAIKDPRAKSAAIWILGEYCSLISNVDVLLDPYLDTFHDEEPLVQLQILSSLVKVYLSNPDDTRDQLQFVLNEATKESTVPDVRNRALIYWRLLSADPAEAKSIVVFSKEAVSHSGISFDEAILNELIRNMGSVSGVLHIVPSDFVKRTRFVPDTTDSIDTLEVSVIARNWEKLRLNDTSFLEAFFDCDSTSIYLKLVNKSPAALTKLAFALNINPLGLVLGGEPKFPETIEFGDTAEVVIPIAWTGNPGHFDKNELQMALRTSMGDLFAVSRLPIECATVANDIGENMFKQNFTNIQNTVNFKIEDARIDQAQLAKRNIYFVGSNENKTYVNFTIGKSVFVAEIVQEERSLSGIIKSNDLQLLPLVQANAQYLFAAK